MTDSGDSARNDSVTTTSNQRVTCRLDDSVAIATGVISRVSTGYHDACQPATVPKRQVADAGDRVSDGNTCQGTAIIKRQIADGGDRVGNNRLLRCCTFRKLL